MDIIPSGQYGSVPPPAGALTQAQMYNALTPMFNISSRCPVVAVPSGRDPSGRPTGVQVVARPYEDATALAVAAAIERVAPWGYDGLDGSLCTPAGSTVD